MNYASNGREYSSRWSAEVDSLNSELLVATRDSVKDYSPRITAIASHL